MESYSDNLFGLYNPYNIDNNLGCPQTILTINDKQNTVYVNYGTIMVFKVCGYPNADFIIQNIGTGETGGSGGDVSTFYPYDVIDRGKLDSDGIHISSMPLNKVGTFIFRAGIWCTVADLDYCTQVSNAIMVTVLEEGCTPNWQCKQPLNGYEYDTNYCGEIDRVATRCKPECGGIGCDGGSESKTDLFKIGALVAVAGASIYLVEDREKRKAKKR